MARNYAITEWPLFAFEGAAEEALLTFREEGYPKAMQTSVSAVVDAVTADESDRLIRAGQAFETAVLAAIPKAQREALLAKMVPSEVAYGVYATIGGEGYAGALEEQVDAGTRYALAKMVSQKKPNAYTNLEGKLMSVAYKAASRCCKGK